MDELVNKNFKSGRLSFTSDLKYAVQNSNVIFICVGTPTSNKNNSANLNQVYKVVNNISKYINKFKIIVTKSTVPVTTGDFITKLISKKKIKSCLKLSLIQNF